MAIRVVIISPYRGDRDINTQYALACCEDCIDRGEAPFASHLLYPMFLDDDQPGERSTGMWAGREWMAVANLVAVYSDLGVSEGMQADLEFAKEKKLRIVYRTLPVHVLDAIRGL